MYEAAGIIFSNLHDKNITELTGQRTMAAVPFACRYRLIDFALSNLVNADIYNISVITHYNYHSLMEHIGTGRDWGLERRNGGIKILPPFINAYANAANFLYNSRLEALQSVSRSLDFNEPYVVLSDCDAICNLDLREMIEEHIASGAQLTIAVHPEQSRMPGANVIYHSDHTGAVTGVDLYNPSLSGVQDVCMNVMVMDTAFLHEMLMDASAHNYGSFLRDIIVQNIGKRSFRLYRHKGYFANIKSLSDYFRLNLQLAQDKQARDQLFAKKDRPILSRVMSSAPTKYNSSQVELSLIADGCVIDGRVENSVLFRGVRVGKNTVIRNSVLFENTVTGEDVRLSCVITDKNVSIRDGRVLSGHEDMPFFIEKGKML